MNWLTLAPQYFYWHYTKGAKDFIAVWSNLLWFEFHFFSVPIMVRTLFVPFRRLGESYPKFANIWEYFSAFIVNTLMRLVGAVLRFVIIIIGLVTWILLFSLGLLAFLIWLILPALLVFMFIKGVYYLT